MIAKHIYDKLYIDHIVLTVANLSASKVFYCKLFNNPEYTDEESVMYTVGETKLFLVEQRAEAGIIRAFNPNIVGLEHLAFGVRTATELEQIAGSISEEGIIHSGIHIDIHSNREKIYLNDPSGIRIEFYIRP